MESKEDGTWKRVRSMLNVELRWVRVPVFFIFFLDKFNVIVLFIGSRDSSVVRAPDS